ncbi:uncharacterized protein LOC114446551, partial [Parambassis ranga]|uniref:Uncharacterized protein LOC114446551 n=1 Tax=Parambassis ranga TaxID=210632 RepID=A0A6P7JM96_9TELE
CKAINVKALFQVCLLFLRCRSIDSSASPPQHTEVIPTEGNPDDQANGDVISAQKDAQTEGTRMGTKGDTESHAPTGELLQNEKAQAENVSVDTTVENKEGYSDGAVGRSNVETFAVVSADVHVEEPVSLVKESPGAVSPVEPAEQPLSSTAAEIKEHVDTPADPSNAEQNEAKVSADANVANPVADISAVAGRVENKAAAEVPAVPTVKLECEEKSFKTEPTNATNPGDAQVEMSIHPREGCEDIPEQTTEDIVVYATKVVVDIFPETTEVNNALVEEEAPLHTSVDSVLDILVESVTESPSHPTAESESSEKCPQEDAKGETVAAAAKIIAELMPEATVMNNTTHEEDGSLQACVKTVPGLLAESISQLSSSPADGIVTEETGVKCAARDTKEPPTEAPSVITATPEETPLQNSKEPVPDTQLKLDTEPAAETIVAICEKTPEQHTQETVDTAVVADVESLVEIPVAETEVCCGKSPGGTKEKDEVQSEIEGGSLKILTENTAVSGEETSLQNSEDSLPETQLKLATETAPETTTEICWEHSQKQYTIEATEVPADVEVESSPETPAVNTAAQGEGSGLQTSEEAAPDTESEVHPQPAAETEVSCEKSPLEGDAKETVEAAAEEESSPETPAVNTATQEEGSGIQTSEEPAPDTESELQTPPVDTATPEETVPQNREEALLNVQPKLVSEPGVEINCEKSPDISPKETTDSAVVVDVASPVEIPLVNTDEAAPQKGDDSVHDSQYSPAAEIVAETEISGEKSPPEEDAIEIIEALVEMASPPKAPPVNTVAPEGTALQSSVEPVPASQLKTSTEPAETTTAVVACEKSLEQDTKEMVEAVAEIEGEAHESPGVNNATTEETSVQNKRRPTDVCGEKSPPEECIKETVGPAETEVVSHEVSTVKTATPEEETPVKSSEEPLPDTKPKLVAPPAAEIEVNCEKSHSEQGSDKTAEAEDDVTTSPEIPAVTTAAPVENSVLKASEDPVHVTRSELVFEPVAETAVSCEKNPQQQSAQETSKAPVKAEIESLSETPTDPAPESRADHVLELKTEDALDKSVVDRALELTDALDVEPPTAEIASKPEKDPKESPTEVSIPNYSGVIQKPGENMQSAQTPKESFIGDYTSICSFCKQTINGNVKIMFGEPPINSHPECLKCGVCTRALGDLLTPMFLRDQVILCDRCFRKPLETTEA